MQVILNMDNSSTFQAAARLPKETRVAVLFQRLGPYHHARLNAAGRLMSVWGVEACVTEDTYAWDKVEGANAFTRVTLTDHYSGDRRWERELQQKTWRTLDEIKPQVVLVNGWSSPEALSALWWCGKTGVPAVVMSETTAWDMERKWHKELIKRRLLKLCSASLVGGRAHADYLNQLGMERTKIFFGYDVVDNDYFAARAKEVRDHESAIRSQHGLPEKYFLASARFIEKKNLKCLIEAYARYRELAGKGENGRPTAELWDLVLLGDGPLKSDLQDLIANRSLQPSVHLPGFKQYAELPTYYALARTFIHASTIEQWGLVVNEALASGLPVLVSNRCGCAADLVQAGRNGYCFDPCNVEALAQLMWKLSDPAFPLSEFGSASRQIAEQFDASEFAKGLSGAVTWALSNPTASFNLADKLCLSSLMYVFRGALMT